MEGESERRENDDAFEREQENFREYIRYLKEKYPQLDEPQASERSDSEPEGGKERTLDKNQMDSIKEESDPYSAEKSEGGRDQRNGEEQELKDDIPRSGGIAEGEGQRTKSEGISSDVGLVRNGDSSRRKGEIDQTRERESTERQDAIDDSVEPRALERLREQIWGNYPDIDHAGPHEDEISKGSTASSDDPMAKTGQQLPRSAEANPLERTANHFPTDSDKRTGLKTQNDLGSAKSIVESNGKSALPNAEELRALLPEGNNQVRSIGRELILPSELRVSIAENQDVRDVLAVISSRAHKVSGSENAVRFDLWAPQLEEKTGLRFSEGKTYVIKGKIPQICEFQTVHSMSKYQGIDIRVPKRHADEVEVGKKYDIIVNSIEEKEGRNGIVARRDRNWVVVRIPDRTLKSVERTDDKGVSGALLEFVMRNNSKVSDIPHTFFARIGLSETRFWLTSIGAKEGDRFEVLRRRRYTLNEFAGDFEAHKPKSIENVTVRLDKGKLEMRVDGQPIPLNDYLLSTKGPRACLRMEIEGRKTKLDFDFDGERVTPRVAGRGYIIRKIRFVGHEAGHLAVNHESASNSPRYVRKELLAETTVRPDRVRVVRAVQPFEWRDIGNWIDTEGGIYATKVNVHISVAQRADRVPLDAFAKFLNDQDIRCKIYKSGPDFHAVVTGAENVAKVVKEVEPYLRTAKRQRQVARLEEFLAAPRKFTRSSLKRARDILGV